MVRLLVSGTPPANRSISCSGAVAEPYIPVGSIDVDDFTDALDAVVTIQNEVLTEPRVLFWNGSGSVTAGCRFGGTLRVSLGFAGEKVVFNDCEMADGMVFSGTGDYDFASGRVALDITFDGGSLT